ncbi:MAG: ribosomal subunit interface protein [Candidatus Sungbacteria bacterium RIFCSPLOWO2_01_FULL_54_21]|uniref:Ribosomal subunit interface protein n=2 Tax=Candidatus Sungiibacteriota TaxID=1817917 RepID=A0A1G2L5B0_9BACT|nr:MAG: ribosomal subunit interface protein [Candidatus Sungbacteria bacterium RIFCSPHIGHO2_02_FULL_53_17]OHA06856.1 MAG: ribosomal subunit interface protein [Candidatus Sungbacteria bacterium RIFCSPLOWO2_01_FULL_54_21]
MRITIRQRNFTITPAFRAYMEQKIVRPAERLLASSRDEDLPLFDIEVERTTRHHRKGQVYRVEVNMTIGKKLIRAEATDEDPRSACDLLEEELKREIRSFKTKSRTLVKRGGRKAKSMTRDGGL